MNRLSCSEIGGFLYENLMQNWLHWNPTDWKTGMGKLISGFLFPPYHRKGRKYYVGKGEKVIFEIIGKGNTARCYAKVVENEAIEQIRRICD